MAKDFTTVCGRQTDNTDLDARLAKTKAKRQALLQVLEKPFLPVTNNPAELAAPAAGA